MHGLLTAFLEDDVGIHTFALHLVGEANNSSFGHSRMLHQGVLHLSSAQPVPGDIDDVVHPSCDLIEALLVPQGAVASEVVAFVGGEVGVDKPLVVTMDSPGDCYKD